MERSEAGNSSPPLSSSPPTPPSPLPVSVGPGHQRYDFSPSPSPSPPFSPRVSSRTSPNNDRVPFMLEKRPTGAAASSTFSLDGRDRSEPEAESSCLRDLLEWLVQRCCSCCSWCSESSVHSPKIHSH